jgi:hypothetical protein
VWRLDYFEFFWGLVFRGGGCGIGRIGETNGGSGGVGSGERWIEYVGGMRMGIEWNGIVGVDGRSGSPHHFQTSGSSFSSCLAAQNRRHAVMDFR